MNTEHPDFKTQKNHWSKIGLLFNGGSEILNAVEQFLFRRPQEPQDEFSYRCKRFYYVNLLSSLSWYGAKIFRGTPQLVLSKPLKNGTPGPTIDQGDQVDFYTALVSNCDRGGTPLHRFFIDIFLDALLYQTAWYATDKADLGDVTKMNLKDYNEAGGNKPYLVKLDPQNIINWGTNDTGDLEFVVVRTMRSKRRFLAPPEETTDWWYFDRQEFRHYQAKTSDLSNNSEAVAKMVNSGAHALTTKNRVPIQRMILPRGLWLGDRAYLACVEHLNRSNELSFGLTFGCLIMPVYKTESEVKPKLGEAALIRIKPGDSFEWSEPKGDVFKIMMEYLRDLREEVYRSLYLTHQGRDSRTAPTVQSGVARVEDQRASAEVLEAYGGIIATSISNGMADIRAARGDDDLKVDLKGFEFIVEISRDRMDKLLAALAADIGSKTFEQEVKIELTLDTLPTASDQVRHAIVEEIRAAPSKAEAAAAAAQAAEDARLASLATGLDVAVPGN